MKQDNSTQDKQVSNEKPEIKKIQYNIDSLEHSFSEDQEYNDFSVEKRGNKGEKKNVDSIRIIFENGSKYRLSKIDESTVEEETFEKNDSHSSWESNKFDAEDLVEAAQVVIDEYNQKGRETREDFNDWYMVQEVIF